MTKSRIVTFVALVSLAIVACGKPPPNAERSAECKDSGNARMCGVCCKTKMSTFTPGGMNAGVCECFGDVEK